MRVSPQDHRFADKLMIIETEREFFALIFEVLLQLFPVDLGLFLILSAYPINPVQ